MTDTTDKPTTTKAPAYIVNTVQERGENRYFKPIGAAWRHGKGTGITIKLDAHPIGDEIVLFEPSAKPE